MGLIDLDPALRWPRGILPYAFDPAISGVPSRLAIANQAIAERSAKSHLRFIEQTNEPGFLYFRYTPDGGCQSDLGYDGKKHNVNCQFGSIGIVLVRLRTRKSEPPLAVPKRNADPHPY